MPLQINVLRLAPRVPDNRHMANFLGGKMTTNSGADNFRTANLVDGVEDLDHTTPDSASAADIIEPEYFIPQLTQHMTATWRN